MGFRGRKPKGKFDDLDSEFKSSIEGAKEEEIRTKIAKISLDQAALMDAKEKDEDLKEKKQIAKEAGAIYREGTKMNRLRIAYARFILDARGKEAGTFQQP